MLDRLIQGRQKLDSVWIFRSLMDFVIICWGLCHVLWSLTPIWIENMNKICESPAHRGHVCIVFFAKCANQHCVVGHHWCKVESLCWQFRPNGNWIWNLAWWNPWIRKSPIATFACQYFAGPYIIWLALPISWQHVTVASRSMTWIARDQPSLYCFSFWFLVTWHCLATSGTILTYLLMGSYY